MADRRTVQLQRARQCREVQQPAVDVGEHGPQGANSCRRHPYPELREITLDQRGDIAGEPQGTRLVVRQFVDGRQPAPQPALRPRVVRREFGGGESAQLQDSEASGEGLGGNPQERRSGRAQQHQPARSTVLIDDVADYREQIGSALHFVDADRTGMVAEEQFRIGSDQGRVRGALQVVVRMAGELMANEGALADLARSDDEGHRKGGEIGSQTMGQRAGDVVHTL